MGCWYETCMLSKLPILDGDRVQILFLAKTPDNSRGRCYSTAERMPLPFILDGTYDEYGSAELLSDYKDYLKLWFPQYSSFNDVIDSSLQEDLLVEQRTIKINPDNNSVSYETILVPCEHVFIRSDVYNELMSGFGVDRWDQDPLTGTELVSSGLSFVNEVIEAHEQGDELLKFRALTLSRSDNTFCRNLYDAGFSLAGDPYSKFGAALGDTDLLLLRLLVNTFAEIIMLTYFMEAGRNCFAVPSGSGSQDNSTKIQRKLATTTLKIADKIDSQWDED